MEKTNPKMYNLFKAKTQQELDILCMGEKMLKKRDPEKRPVLASFKDVYNIYNSKI